MGSYMIKRLALTVPLLVVISLLAFLLVNLSPMDPAEMVLRAQEVPEITEPLLEQTRERLGMDQPLLVRYAQWLGDGLRLNFGESYVSGQPVWSMLGPALWNTFKLTLISCLLIILLSVFFGVVCAMNEGRTLDLSVRGVTFLLTAMPSYWLASLCIWYFSVKLDLLPTSGMDSYLSYILPVFVIASGYVGLYFRNVRSAMLANLHEGYVQYGRACGLSEGTILKHVLRNSLQVAVSIFCMSVPIILGGTVVIENVFAWPGAGRLAVKAILGRDLPVIQAYVLVLAVTFVAFNALSDLIHAALNPRWRKEAS